MAFYTKKRKIVVGGTVIEVEISRNGAESVVIGEKMYDKDSEIAKSFSPLFCQLVFENSTKDGIFAFENRLLWNNEDTRSMLYEQEIAFRKAFSKHLKHTLESGSTKGVVSILETGIIESKSLLEMARDELEKPRGFKGAIYKAVKGALDFVSSVKEQLETPKVDISKYTTAKHNFNPESQEETVSKNDIFQATMLDFMRVMTETQEQLEKKLGDLKPKKSIEEEWKNMFGPGTQYENAVSLEEYRKINESDERVERAIKGEPVQLQEGDDFWSMEYKHHMRDISPRIATVLIAEEFQKNNLAVNGVSKNHERIILNMYDKIGISNPLDDSNSECFTYDKVEDLALRKRLIDATRKQYEDFETPYAKKIIAKMDYFDSIMKIQNEEKFATESETPAQEPTINMSFETFARESANAAYDVKQQNSQEEDEQKIAEAIVDEEIKKQDEKKANLKYNTTTL